MHRARKDSAMTTNVTHNDAPPTGRPHPAGPLAPLKQLLTISQQILALNKVRAEGAPAGTYSAWGLRTASVVSAGASAAAALGLGLLEGFWVMA